MASDKVDVEQLLKDHVRKRLMECGWTDKLSHFVRSSVRKRAANGQSTNTIKFDELYKDVKNKARDAMSIEMEIECHEKIHQYLSLKGDKTDETSSSFVSSPLSPSDLSDASDIPSEILLDISSEIISTEVVPKVISTEAKSNAISTEIPSEIISTEVASDVIFTEDIPEIISTEDASEIISTEDATEIIYTEDASKVISSEFFIKP